MCTVSPPAHRPGIGARSYPDYATHRPLRSQPCSLGWAQCVALAPALGKAMQSQNCHIVKRFTHKHSCMYATWSSIRLYLSLICNTYNRELQSGQGTHYNPGTPPCAIHRIASSPTACTLSPCHSDTLSCRGPKPGAASDVAAKPFDLFTEEQEPTDSGPAPARAPTVGRGAANKPSQPTRAAAAAAVTATDATAPPGSALATAALRGRRPGAQPAAVAAAGTTAAMKGSKPPLPGITASTAPSAEGAAPDASPLPAVGDHGAGAGPLAGSAGPSQGPVKRQREQGGGAAGAAAAGPPCAGLGEEAGARGRQAKAAKVEQMQAKEAEGLRQLVEEWKAKYEDKEVGSCGHICCS